MAADFKFGDLICYRNAEPHDAALMYVGPCGHERNIANTLIDIWDITTKWTDAINCKSDFFWQHCTHLKPVDAPD